MDISIRPGPQALSEATACAAIHAAAFAKSGARGWSEQEMTDLLDRQSALLVFTAHAFLLAEIVCDEAEIITFAVNPAQQDQGLGRALLAAFLDACRSRKVTRCILEVATNNTNAIKVYESDNFSRIAVRENYFQLDTGLVSALVMEQRFEYN